MCAHWYEQRRERLSAIAARADQQYKCVLAGDPRGTYGGGVTANEGNRSEMRRV